MQNSPSWQANSFSGTNSILCHLHKMSVHYYFHHSLTDLISSAHPHSVLTYIFHWKTLLLQPTCSVHFKQNADTRKWGTKKWDNDKSSNPLSNTPISNWHKQHLMQLQPQTSPTSSHTMSLNFNSQTKITITNTTSPAKLPALNWHNQYPNIATVQMLMVLLQPLFGEVWDREFSYLWQQCKLQCVCNWVYIYKRPLRAELIVHYD